MHKIDEVLNMIAQVITKEEKQIVVSPQKWEVLCIKKQSQNKIENGN